MLTHRDSLDWIHEEVKCFHPPFPDFGNVPFLWHTLRIAGKPLPYCAHPHEFLQLLFDMGAEPINPTTHKLAPLDLYVLAEGQYATGLGFVIKELESKPGNFLGIDHTARSPQQIKISDVRGFLSIGYT